MDSGEQRALVPITEALPELRAEQYAKVRQWDAARMALAGEYEAADGEYLKLIREALKIAGHGLWTRYLEARRIPDSTARRRIQVAEGRFERTKPLSDSGSHSVSVIAEPVPAPPPLPTWTAPAVQPTPWPEMMDVPLPSSEHDAAEPMPEPMPEPPAFLPMPSGADAPFRSFVEAAAESPEARSLPMDAQVRVAEMLIGGSLKVTEDVLDCWLELASSDDCERVHETFNRVGELAARVCMRIVQHQQRGLRIVR